MKKILILSGLSLLAAFAVRAQDKVTEYNVRPAIVVRTPIQGDSINFTGEKFTADKLLKTDIDSTSTDVLMSVCQSIRQVRAGSKGR